MNLDNTHQISYIINMETNDISPMPNAPKFDPKKERERYYAVRAAGAVWVVFLCSYVYLFIHWLTS